MEYVPLTPPRVSRKGRKHVRGTWIVPLSLHTRMKRSAKQSNVSMTFFIEAAVRDAVSRAELERKKNE